MDFCAGEGKTAKVMESNKKEETANKQEISQTRLLKENYEKLIKALGEDKGLQALTDIGHEILQNPIVIADTSMKILAVTSSYYEEIINRIPKGELEKTAVESTRNKEISSASLDFLKATKRYSMFYTNPAPHIVNRETIFKVSGIRSPYDFLDFGVCIRENVVAFGCVSGINRSFDEGDLEYCRILSDLIRMELEKDDIFIGNYGLSYEILMKDLLEERLSSSSQARIRFRNLGKNLKENLYAAVVRREVPQTAKGAMPQIQQSMVRSFFPGSTSVMYKDDIVLLLSCEEKEKIDIGAKTDFTEFLQNNHMKAGISEVFNDPICLRKYYGQAVKAIELGEKIYPQKQAYSYYDLSLFHIFELSEGQMDLKDLAHPLVLKLNSSGNPADKELLKTLYVWLSCGRNTEKITQILHIHRSTLYYRLNKIRDMLGEDLEDGEVSFRLMLSFKLIEYGSHTSEKIGEDQKI